MTEPPILAQLERDWAARPLPSAPADPEGNPAMDLAGIEQDIRTRVQDVIARAEEDVTRGKEILEQHLPQLAHVADAFQGSAIVQALEGAVLSPADEAFIASLVKRLDTAAAAEAEAPAAAALDDAQAAMAEAAAAPVAGPTVGGVA